MADVPAFLKTVKNAESLTARIKSSDTTSDSKTPQPAPTC